MKTWEIKIDRAWDSDAFAQAIESTAEMLDLTVSLKGTLRTYPGCLHWHFKKDGKSGTIEATLWAREQRVWLSVQAGRSAEWIRRDVQRFVKHLRTALGKEH